MKKRIIALFLAVLMLCTLLPSSAFAANTITNQNIEDAIAYAKKQVGRKNSDGTPYWKGYCAAFVYHSYHDGAKIKNSSYATARQMGDALLTNTDSNPPRGAFVFWYKASNPQGAAGHVGISLGGGKVIHSWGSSGILESSISYITGKGYTYRGWGSPIKGYRLATDNAQPTNTTPTISISGEQYPTAITQGSNYGLRGTISTNCGKLTYVKGSILNFSGSAVQTASANPNTASYDIKNGVINNNLKFGTLKAGTYRYVVYAEAQNGTAKASKTLIDKTFTVTGTNGTISVSKSGITGTYSGSTISSTINVSYTKPSGVSKIYLNYKLENCSGNVSCSWGDWINDSTCPIYVKVTGPETCNIVVRLCDKSNDNVLATAKVSVNVVSYCTANGHSYSYKVTTSPTTSSTGTLTGTCSRCGVTRTVSLPKLNTTDYSYSVTKAASCTASGTAKYTWKTTTYGTFSFSVTLPKTAHSYTTAVTAPTCTAQGYTTHTCSKCGDSYKDNYKDKLEHNWDSGVVTLEPTETNVGLIVYTCKNCGQKYTESIAPVDHTHNYVLSYTVNPTVDQIGYKAYSCIECGDWHFADYKLAAPIAKISTSASSGKPTLKWDAVDGAEQYKIYRSTSKNGTYSYMYTTAKTSYTNTSAKAGTTYYYKIKSVSQNAETSSYSAVNYITCDLARPVVKITLSSANHPKLTWASVSGASKYEIYRATSKSGTYSKMYTTTKTSYTNTSAKAGKTYYYKVKAICGSNSYGNSAYSTVVSIKAK